MNEQAAQPPRERRHQKNLRRILDAATAVVVDGGFDALSINKLAAGLDYTPGALYRYFPSKDALIAAMVGEVVAEVGAHIERAVAAVPGAPPLVRVVACARAWRAFADADPNRFGLVAMLLAVPRLVLQDEAHVAPAIGAMLQAVRPLAAALADAEASGALSATPGAPPFDRPLALFAGLQGALLLKKQALRAPDLIDVARLSNLVLRSMLAGWGASPADLERALATEPTP